jgi:hypothetical protein
MGGNHDCLERQSIPLPPTSSLCTEMLDLESYIDSITGEERVREQPRSIIDAATALVRDNTELLPAIETLR